jgi:hypothetical protein
MGAILSTILPGLPPPLCNEGASTTDTYKFESKKPLQQRQWPYVRGAVLFLIRDRVSGTVIVRHDSEASRIMRPD